MNAKDCKNELKPVPSHPGYSITLSRKVWSHKRNKWLKKRVDKSNGYVTVSLPDRKWRRPVPIHCLMLETFVGPCPEGAEGRHLDGNKLNNNLANLTWGSSFENTQGVRFVQ